MPGLDPPRCHLTSTSAARPSGSRSPVTFTLHTVPRSSRYRVARHRTGVPTLSLAQVDADDQLLDTLGQGGHVPNGDDLGLCLAAYRDEQRRAGQRDERLNALLGALAVFGAACCVCAVVALFFSLLVGLLMMGMAASYLAIAGLLSWVTRPQS